MFGINLSLTPGNTVIKGVRPAIVTDPTLAAAWAAYKAGTKNFVIAGIGSSTLRGEKSGNGTTNQYVNGWLSKVAAKLRERGENARHDAFFGAGSTLNRTLANYDPRIAMTGEWYTQVNGYLSWTDPTEMSLGGIRLRAAAAASLVFTPELSWDRMRVYYQSFPTSGSASLTIGGSSSTIDRNAAEAVASAQFSATLGVQSATLAWASGSFGVIGMRPTRSDRAEIEFLNFAAGSADITINQYGTAVPNIIYPYNAIDDVGALDLFVIAIGRNEWANASSVSTMTSRAQAYGERAQTMGAQVCIALPHQESLYVSNGGATYVQALRDLATTKGWLVVDFTNLFGAYSAGAAWESGDGTHKNDTGHQMMADLFARQIFGV